MLKCQALPVSATVFENQLKKVFMGGPARLVGRVGDRGLVAALRAIAGYVLNNTFKCEIDAYIALRRAAPIADGALVQPVGLRFGQIDLHDAQSIDALVRAWPVEWRGELSESAIRRTIESDLIAGDLCFAYWDGDVVAAASWIGFRTSPYLRKFAKAFGLAEDEALRRTTFVAPGYRGKKLQVLLAAELENHVARARGVRRFLVYVGIRNIASLRNLMKVYEESRPLYHVRLTLLGREIDWFPNKERLPWIRMHEKKE